jgi:hypothetical protein
LSDFRCTSEFGMFQTTKLARVMSKKTLIAARPATEFSSRCCTPLSYTCGFRSLQ